MKRFYFALLLTLVFIFLSVTADAYIEKTNSELTELFNKCLISAEKQNLEQINILCKQADKLWDSRKTVYCFLVHTDKTDAFNDSFELLQSVLYSHDYNNVKILTIQCIQSLEDISETEKISIDNILKMTAGTKKLQS